MNKLKLKILMIAATPFFSDRGSHIRTYCEAKYLQKIGHKILICTYGLGKNIPEISISRTINPLGYNKTTPGFSWHKIYLNILLLIKTFKKYHQFKPDIIQAQGYESVLIGYLVKIIYLNKCKLILDCQGSLKQEAMGYNNIKSRYAQKFLHQFEKMLLKLPENVIVSSTNASNYLIKHYKLKQQPLLLQDGYDPDLFINKLSKKTAISQPNKIKTIIYTGGINSSKGLDLVFKQIPGIIKQNNNIKFLFVGYGSDISKYKQLINKKRLSSYVNFTGRTDYFKLSYYLKQADIAIDPKFNSTEASGKILFYIAANLPVICQDNPHNRSLLQDQGIYFNDTENFSKTVLKNLNTKKLNYKNISNLSWQHIILKLESYYNNLISK